MIIEKDYPKIEGDVITILNCYGNTANGQEMVLDFSLVEVETLKKEAMQCIVEKYNDREASPLYLKVLVPAVRHFSRFAMQNNIPSFKEYKESISQQYRTYLETLTDENGERYSIKYQRYLLGVPRTIKNYLEGEEG